MIMTLFTVSPTDEITQEMVEHFCQLGIREAARVDYKQDFPSDLAKHVAAFANTHGGLILIGVRTDQENRPLIPIDGIEFERGISERVYQICVSSISPPVFPDLWVVRLGEERCAVVIRVPESDATPHAVDGRQGIYLRTGNISNPFTRATVEDIQELLRRRKVAAERKEHLVSRFRNRWEFFKGEYTGDYLKKSGAGLGRYAVDQFMDTVPLTELICVPAFPKEVLASIPELRRTVLSFPLIRVTSKENWPLGRGKLRSVQEGIIQHSGGTFLQLAEFNSYGMVGYSESSTEVVEILERYIKKPYESPEAPMYVCFDDVYPAILGFLISAVGFYQALNYWGSVEISVRLANMSGKYLLTPSISPSRSSLACPDYEISWQTGATVLELKDNLGGLFSRALQYVCASFGDEREDLEEAALKELELAKEQVAVRHYLQATSSNDRG
jgi:hypothetical protein